MLSFQTRSYVWFAFAVLEVGTQSVLILLEPSSSKAKSKRILEVHFANMNMAFYYTASHRFPSTDLCKGGVLRIFGVAIPRP